MSDATRQLAMLVVALSALLGPSARAQSFVARHSSVERLGARLEVATSATERASIATQLGLHGPVGPVAEHLARALGTELDPVAQEALLVAACRVLVRDAEASRPALDPVLIERYGGASPGERPPWARALGASGSPAALEALLARIADPSAADALIAARPLDAVLAALVASPSEALLDLIARLADARSIPALLGLLGPGSTVEVAAIRSLGAVAAEAPVEMRIPAMEALLARARSTDDAWLLTALFEALATIGPPGDGAAVLLPRLADPEPTVRGAALRALARLDPAAARPALLSAVDHDEERALVRGVLARSDAPELVEVAERMAAIETERDAALDALARARDGAGLPALLRLGAPPIAIALSLRRGGGLEASTFDDPVARAVGRLPVDFGELADTDARVRQRAAMAMAASDAPPIETIEAALRREPDRRVRAWLLEAARRHGASLDGRWLVRALTEAQGERGGDVEVAGLLAVVPRARATAAERRRLHAMLGAALRSSSPAVRATAAMTLGAMGAIGSSAAIEALLEDAQAAVRIAAGTALMQLAPDRSPSLAARARIDTDPRVARLLAGAASGIASAPRDVLVVGTEVHGELSVDAVWLEVQTDDGWVRTLPAVDGGPFVLTDVPGATAEVRLRVRE